jgi:hypothetical protein
LSGDFPFAEQPKAGGLSPTPRLRRAKEDHRFLIAQKKSGIIADPAVKADGRERQVYVLVSGSRALTII